MRTFRDRLRSNPNLVAEYVACKRRIIAGGVTVSVDYSIRKGEFVAAVLESPDREGGESMRILPIRPGAPGTERSGPAGFQWGTP